MLLTAFSIAYEMFSVVLCCRIRSVVVMYLPVRAKLGVPVYAVPAEGQLISNPAVPQTSGRNNGILGWIQDFDFSLPLLSFLEGGYRLISSLTCFCSHLGAL